MLPIGVERRREKLGLRWVPKSDSEASNRPRHSLRFLDLKGEARARMEQISSHDDGGSGVVRTAWEEATILPPAEPEQSIARKRNIPDEIPVAHPS